MGNGALPHGPSDRAHPRLYHRVTSLRCQSSDAVGGEADMPRASGACRSGAFDPTRDIGQIEILQRSNLLAARCVLSSIRSTGLLPGADLPRNACLDTRENGMTRICFILLSVLGLAFASGEAWAQAWPTRPIRAVVAFSAGGIVDVMARLGFGQALRP